MKTSSLVFFIGVTELFGDAEIRYSTTFKPVEYFLAVAFWYPADERLESDSGANRTKARGERAW